MKIFVCKMCGRAVKAEKQPLYCYADRMDSIEEVGPEDAVKMGLFSTTNGNLLTDLQGNEFIVEFSKDVRFCPFDGQGFLFQKEPKGSSMTEFQDLVMQRVRQ